MHSRPEKSSITRMENAQQVAKQLGRDPVELQLAPELPKECMYLWDIFTKLAGVSYQEIQAYCNVTGERLYKWETDALIGLDRARQNPPTRFLWLKK